MSTTGSILVHYLRIALEGTDAIIDGDVLAELSMLQGDIDELRINMRQQEQPQTPHVGYFNEDGSYALVHYEDYYDEEMELTCGNTEHGEMSGAIIMVSCAHCLHRYIREKHDGEETLHDRLRYQAQQIEEKGLIREPAERVSDEQDGIWLRAKNGWSEVFKWCQAQRAIDNDDVQVQEILNEWLGWLGFRVIRIEE